MDVPSAWATRFQGLRQGRAGTIAPAGEPPGALTGSAFRCARSPTWARLRASARAKAEDVLTVLAARGIAVSEAVRARILGCADVATLDAWIRRAVVASTAAAVVRAKAPARTTAGGTARHAQKT